MLTTPGAVDQNQQMLRDYFENDREISGITPEEGFVRLPFTHTTREFSWAEQVYHAGDSVAVVARYRNLPLYLQHEVDQLILEEYRKKLFRVPLFEAALLLMSSGYLPGFDSLCKRSRQLYSDSCIDLQQKKALDFISCRNPEDIVVLVMRSGRVIGTMTLFPFTNKQDIPSLAYLKMDSAFDKLPDVPALEVGRLAKASCSDDTEDSRGSDLANTMAMAAAFIVAKNFALQNGLLPHPDSYICGDTYGSFISSLKRFFPMEISNSTVNPSMLEDESKVHGMSMYFIQRQVLGSFNSSEDLMSTIEDIERSYPALAARIRHLLESDLKTNGVKMIQNFDPQKFKVNFFYFHYHHPRTVAGFKRLDQMIQRLKGCGMEKREFAYAA